MSAVIESTERAPGLPKRVDRCDETIAELMLLWPAFVSDDPRHSAFLMQRAYHEGYMHAMAERVLP